MKKLISLILIFVLVFTFAGCNKKTSETTSTTKDVEKSTTTTKATTEVESSEASTTTTLPSTTTTTAVTRSLTTTTTTTAKATTTTTTYPNSITESEAQALCDRLRAYGESNGLTWDTSLNENSSAVGYNTSMCGNTESISVEQAYERGCEYLDLKPISQGSEGFNIVFWEVGNGYYTFRCYYF